MVKKELTILFVLFVSVVMVGCNNIWNPKHVMKMNEENQETAVRSVTEDLPVMDEELIQQLFDNAEAKKDELFPASNFDNWVFFMTSIDTENVCTYKFGIDSSGKTWVSENNYEVYNRGDSIGGGQLNKSSNLKYYRYKTRKDRWLADGEQHFDPSSNTNFDDKMLKREERFYFFKFTGTSKGPLLNNSMLCVDTYTKFVFNYSEPGNIGSSFGYKIPSKWQDYADPNISVGNNHTKAYNTLFYMYDPVGYVEENGTVVYYDWANENIKQTNYAPSLHSQYSTIAARDPSKPGCSPYLPLNGGRLSVKAKSITNVSIGGQDLSWFNTSNPVEYGRFNYELKVLSETSVKLDEKKELKLNKDKTKIFSDVKTYVVTNPTSDVIFNVNLSKHDLHWKGAFNAAFSSEINECKISTEDTSIHLIYNGEKGLFEKPELKGNLPDGVTYLLPSDFTLKKGEKKDFSIKYTVNKPDVHCVGSVIVTYELSWLENSQSE